MGVEQHTTHLARQRTFGRHPCIQLALRHLQLCNGLEQVLIRLVAMHPDHVNRCGAVKGLLFPRIFDVYHDQCPAIGGELLQASGDGGDGCFVADQQVAVEDIGNHH